MYMGRCSVSRYVDLCAYVVMWEGSQLPSYDYWEHNCQLVQDVHIRKCRWKMGKHSFVRFLSSLGQTNHRRSSKEAIQTKNVGNDPGPSVSWGACKFAYIHIHICTYIGVYTQWVYSNNPTM